MGILSLNEWRTQLVTVYTQPACMPCRFTKKRLTERGIEFREIDLTTDPDAMNYVKSLGYSSAPVVVTPSGEHWSGLVVDKIDAL